MQKRTLKELINTTDPAWPLVQEWIVAARNNVEVLSPDRKQGEEALLFLQVTARSPLGAIALETGGIFIDHGWLRFLGSGHKRIKGNLLTWNTMENPLKGAFIFAHDAVGGFFAMNGGAFPGDVGTVFYFASDALRWESTKQSFSQFLNWALNGDLRQYYENVRWPGWEDEVANLSGDQGFSIIPFLWTGANPPVAERSRRAIPMTELWGMQQELKRQIGDAKPGTSIKIHWK